MAGKPKKPKNALAPLKGGLGEAALSPQEAIARLGERLEYTKLPMQEKLRKRMLVKDTESRKQIAEATLAAAINHIKVPDEGTSLFGRTFQSLPYADRQSLLSALPANEAQIVQDAFGTDIVEAIPAPQDAPKQPTQPDSVNERARAAAREALKTMGAEAIPVVDLDKYLAPEQSGKTVLPVRKGDKVVTVKSTQGWSDAQVKRGYRRVVYGPKEPGSAPVSRIEVVADRKGEFTTKQPPRAAEVRRKRNPNYGQTRESYRIRREPAEPSAERMVPSDFSQLSPEAQAAAVRGAEIMAFINRMDEYDPEFDQTVEFKRAQAALTQLANAHPEAIPFMDSPMLESQSMPPDAVASQPQGVPYGSTLSYRIGDTGQRNRFEYRPDRRSRSGVPADAPNRQMWEEVNQIEIDPKTGEPTGLRAALPPPDEVVDVINKPIRRNLNYEAPPRLPPPAAKEPTFDELAKQKARTEMLQEQYEAAAEALKKAQSEDTGVAVPVEDISAEPDTSAGPSAFYVTKGTATGAPGRVKADRDFALREGKSMYDKLREKLFRMATEFTDAEQAPVEQFDLGKNEIRRRGGGVSSKSPSTKTLQLDGLVPQWRAYMVFQDGDEIVVRRPRADEIAAELAHQTDLGPDVAAGLIPHVQAAMDALEGTPVSINKHLRAVEMQGKFLPPSDKAMRAMEQRARALRAPNDARPLISDQSKAIMEQGGLNTFSALPAPQGSLEDLQRLAAAAEQDQPAQVQPQAPAADNPFAAFIKKASNGGGTAKTIAGLLAALGAGQASQAQSGELPGVEYLAMSKRRPPRTVGSVVTPPQGGFVPVSPPPPNTTSTVTTTGPLPAQPAQATVASPPVAAATPAPATATPAAQPNTGAVTAQWDATLLTPQQIEDLRNTLGQNAAPQPPAATTRGQRVNDWLKYDPIYQTLRAVGGAAKNTIGRVPLTAAGAALTAPYWLPPVIRGYRSMYNEFAGPQGDSQKRYATEIDLPGVNAGEEKMRPALPLPAPAAPPSDAWDDFYGPQSQQPGENQSTSTVGALLNMMAKRR